MEKENDVVVQVVNDAFQHDINDWNSAYEAGRRAGVMSIKYSRYLLFLGGVFVGCFIQLLTDSFV